jgi:hypothetical protein
VVIANKKPLFNMLIDEGKNKIIIPLDKTKILLLTLVAILFLFVGFWMWFTANSQWRYETIYVKLIAVINIMICILFGSLCFAKLFDKKPGLVIDNHGITNNSTATGIEIIKWNDITDLSVEEVKRTKFILVYVKNPLEYINQSNFFKRFWMKQNYCFYGTPISIASTTLKCKISDLEKILEDWRTKYSA